MDTNVLTARSVVFRYGDRAVLDGFELEVGRGEIFGLLGGNGAGKSTFLQLVLGLLQPQGGKIAVAGHDPQRDPVAARRNLAYVPENVSAYPQFNAFENLRYFLGLAGVAKADDALIEGALRDAGLAAEAWKRPVSTYSKGMRQKLIVALALARDVPLLLLDEPTSGLDPSAMADFFALLLRLKDKGVASLLVTHDLLGATLAVDRLGFLDAGRVAFEARAEGPERFDLRALQRLFYAPEPAR